METAPPTEYHLVGRRNRLTLGSEWIQPFKYFVNPEPGQVIAQVVELVSATPSYGVQLPDGRILEVLSDDVTLWEYGDFVLVKKVYGIWKIVNPGDAVMEDMSNVTRAVCQVRTKSGGSKLVLSFDSADSADITKPRIVLNPDANTTFQLVAPALTGIAPFIYEYDIKFFRTSPAEPVIRQFGDFEIADSITKI